MAVVQAIPAMPAQGRTLRASTTWSTASGTMHTRPWRSSPLAGPGFSTLPPIIPESSEESLDDDDRPPDGPPEFTQTQRTPSSSSILSDTPATSPSGYASRNTSGSASALVLAEDEASISSISLHASSSTHDTSSHSHGNSQTQSRRPARLLKSPGRRPSSAQGRLSSSNVAETFIAPPPRARTVSHGNLAPPLTSSPTPAIPQAYSPALPSPPMSPPETPSTSRDPASNWMSSSPFGPAMIPRFSRLTMASPAVVMPLSAKEYRKRKARESLGKSMEKESSTSSNHVTFTDDTASRPPTLSSVSSSNHCDSPDRQPQPQPQADHPSHVSLSLQPSLPGAKHKRRSRPNTPPRPSPLAAHPPISPKSSTGTFFSLASTSSSDDDTPPPSHARGTDDLDTTQPARPRLRPRRPKSYPERLSNGARLSLLEAMNHLSHESTSHHLSVPSQTDDANRLSVASQVSGHTLFFDVESSGDDPALSGDQDRDGNGDGDGNGASGQQRTSVLATQSLEHLSSTLSRTGIEAIHPSGDSNLAIPLDDKRKAKRNVRISDTLEVSPPPGFRRRRLIKSKPTSARTSTSGHAPGSATANEMKVQMQAQTHERRTSLLPWKSKGSSSDSRGGAPGACSGAAGVGADGKHGEDGRFSTPAKGPVHSEETVIPLPVRQPPVLVTNGPTAVMSNNPGQKSSSASTAPHRTRYSLSFLPSPTLHRPKREKPNTHPAETNLGPGQYTNTRGKPEESSVSGVESGTDSTSTSIRTITQGSQSTLTSASPGLYDLTTVASSGRRTVSPTVPMLRRLNAQEKVTAGVPVQREWDSKGDSTPSLITNGSTTTSSSVPHTISLPPSFRFPGGEPFIPQPSGLKESFTDTFEEDNLEGVHADEERERNLAVCMRRKQDQRSSARARGGETPEEDQRAYLRGRSGSGLSISTGLSPSPRPGTPSSTLTTATETSGSYASISTVPPSSTSSSSMSPSLAMKDKRDRTVSFGGGIKGDGDACACALCGQFVPQSMSPTHEPDQAEMHPMFTVPLVTVPASAMSRVGTYSYMGAGIGNDARHDDRRKSEKHLSVPLSAAATAMNSQGHHHTHANGNEGVPVPAIAVRTTSPPPSVAKVRKLRRPQTAPPGMGDAAPKFIEETGVLHARKGTVDGRVGVGVEGERLMKHKTGGGSGESKFKMMLKGLLRRRG